MIVLTTDAGYRPRIKERPRNHTWDVLKSYQGGIPGDLEPLARVAPFSARPGAPGRGVEGEAPAFPVAWKLKTVKGLGFHYLWNVSADKSYNWLGDDPRRVLFPYNVADDDVRKEFEKKYAGRNDVPIFSDPRVAPAFHGVGAGIFATDPKNGEVLEAGKRFAKWLDANPRRQWGMMSNYHAGAPIGPKGQELFAKYRNRHLGVIAGESLGPAYPDSKVLDQATAGAKTRRELAAIISAEMLKANAQKFRTIYGKDLDANAYEDVISCLSVGNTCYLPLCADWGRTDDRLRVGGNDVIDAGDALGVHARHGPPMGQRHRHLSLLQLRRLRHHLHQTEHLQLAKEPLRQLLQRLFRSGHDVVQV